MGMEAHGSPAARLAQRARTGQANVRKWVADSDDDPLGAEAFATDVLPLNQAPHAYEIFRKKLDAAVKVTLKP